MKLSTRARYSLRACFALASAEDDIVSLPQLSKSTALSEKYLEKLIGMLKRADIVSGVRGAGGGYSLSRKPDDISIASILFAVNELDISDCDSGCKDLYCPNRKMFRKLTASIVNLLENTSLQDYVDENKCYKADKKNESISG